jgi:transposase
MDEIIRFVMLAQSARFTVRELCEQFGISRKTGYKHLERYAADGLKGLAVRSHRPHQLRGQAVNTGIFSSLCLL